MRRQRLTRAFLILALATTSAAAAGDPPQIGKPRPAPPLTEPATPIPVAQYDEQLAIGGDDVKAKLVSTRLSVDTLVNGRGPYRFVVDSGADTSVVGLDIARSLQLPLGTPVVLNNMTTRNVVDRVKVDHLSFGPSSIRDLEVPALREGDLGGQGMLGIDALVQQRLMLDFDKRVIRVEDARKRAAILPGEIVITARRQRGQLILARVRAGGVPLDAVIDTGSEITVGNLALRDKLVRKRNILPVKADVVGVTGVIEKVEIAEIRELQLGTVRLHNVLIAFADLPPFKVFGLADEPALLLGTDVLASFKTVSLDFRNRKVRFQPRGCSSYQGGVTLTAVVSAGVSWLGDMGGCST